MIGSFLSSPQQKVSVPSGQLFDEELGCMASIEQEFISGEYPCVHVDDLHRIKFEIRAFTANKCIETKRIGPQRRCNRAAKLQKPFAIDAVRYVLMMEIFRNLVESAPPLRLQDDGLLGRDAKEIRRSCRVACKGHANLKGIRYERLGNVVSVSFPKKT